MKLLAPLSKLYDREINNKQHKIRFSGKYGKTINESNTVSKLLKLLEKKIKKKFEIKIKKNIPQKSGLGGGSMNASNILKYLLCFLPSN